MDKIDKRILMLLQSNGKITNQEVADQVALSPSPCLRRIKQLEEEGYIDRYTALLNPKKLGLTLTILVSVGLDTHDAAIMKRFESAIRTYPEVMQCHLVAGQAQDYLLMVVVKSLEDYQNFLLKKLTQLKAVKSVHSSFVLRSIVDTTAFPID